MSVVETPSVAVPVVTEEEERRRDVFLRAAEIVERDGWERGPRGMATRGPVCLLGAVGRALGREAVIDEPIYGVEVKDGFVEDVLVSEESYDYSVTGAFVLGLSLQTVKNNMVDNNNRICGIWHFSDRTGKEHVAKALRAMANGKRFDEAISDLP